MAFIDWDNSFSVNVKEIDDQHKKLVGMVNEFYTAIKNDEKAALGGLLTSMAEYTVFHFSTEEKYFDRFKYPATATHKAEHKDFVAKVSAVKTRFEAGKPVMSLELTSFLKKWLIDHVKGSDKKYSEHFNAHGLK